MLNAGRELAPLSVPVIAFCKKHAKQLVAALDILIIPAWLFVGWLSSVMLSTDKPCGWTKVGLRCGTCGGTHCVNAFTAGRIEEAFGWNAFVFIGICYALLSALLLNVATFRRSAFAHSALRRMYSLSMFFTGISAFVAFTVCRNIFDF